MLWPTCGDELPEAILKAIKKKEKRDALRARIRDLGLTMDRDMPLRARLRFLDQVKKSPSIVYFFRQAKHRDISIRVSANAQDSNRVGAGWIRIIYRQSNEQILKFLMGE